MVECVFETISIFLYFGVQFVRSSVSEILLLHFSLLTSNKNWPGELLRARQSLLVLVLGSDNIADKPIDNKRAAPHPAIIESISHNK